MKSRSRIIMAFLLCACLIVGVGYAAFTDYMDVNGQAEMNANEVVDGRVIFTEVEALDAENTININTNNPDKASFTIHNILSEGQTATFVLTIENTNTTEMFVKFTADEMRVTEDAKNYYTIAAEWLDDPTMQGDYAVIAANNGTLRFQIVVELTQPADKVLNASFLTTLEVSDSTQAVAE